MNCVDDETDIKKLTFFFLSIWLDVPHLTNEHITQDCIAS